MEVPKQLILILLKNVGKIVNTFELNAKRTCLDFASTRDMKKSQFLVL